MFIIDANNLKMFTHHESTSIETNILQEILINYNWNRSEIIEIRYEIFVFFHNF